MSDVIARQLDELYQAESRRVLATLIRLLGDFELAEEALHEAFAAAMQQWPEQGVPANPVAWLVSAGRFKGIDQIRRSRTAHRHLDELALTAETAADLGDTRSITDDQLRLIFTCCHPGLAGEARLALTLREMCGLTTEQVAAALLQKTPTVAQRIVRAKRKIRDAGIPYEVPEARELPQRLDSVLRVVYLMFNEGYSASAGDSVTDVSLAWEAIRLGQLLCELLPRAGVYGLQALMLLQDSRRNARQTADGELLTLEEQDRALWDRGRIEAGIRCLEQALQEPPAGFYTLQAAIAAVHAEAGSWEHTDWEQIVGLYNVLLQRHPSPVIALNRAVALAMRDGPQSGLLALDALAGESRLDQYHLYHAARADLYRRLERTAEAVQAYRRAIDLTGQGPEQRFLRKRLSEVAGSSGVP